MFKKKPYIKTLSAIRSSDRRKIADRIISDFQISSPTGQQINEPTQDGNATSKSPAKDAVTAHTALRNQILPDNALSAKYSTTHGPELKEVVGTVYIGSYNGKTEQRVLWYSIYDRIYPSVYSLWNVPGLLPLLHTPGIVVQKIKKGADLMTPGLAGPPFPDRAKKDAIVAVADLDNPSVPVAVGTCQIDISALTSTAGVKGVAVETTHWAGDELWDWSTSGKSGIAAPESLHGWLEDDGEEVAQGTEGLSLEEPTDEDATGGVSLDPKQHSYEADDRRNGNTSHLAEVVDTDNVEDMSTRDIDEAFRKAFVFGVYQTKKDHPNEPKYGLEFPLTQSFVMSALVKPYLPTFTLKQAESLDIKKTSWKNIRKFIKTLDKAKLLLSKDRQNNETTVLDIDFTDRTFSEFQPYSLPKREHIGPSDLISASNTDTPSDSSIGQRLKQVTLYRPKDALAPLFAASNVSYRSFFTAPELNPIISAYFEHEHLTTPNNKRNITLGPFFANTLFDPNSSRLDAEILARGTCTRDALTERIRNECTPHYAILRNDETLSTPGVKPKAGTAPKVGIQLETRSGNKTVTRVWGLEPYGIREQFLADELRKACASSTSVETSKQGKGIEVMVQGPQKDAVIAALEKRGVQRAWVEYVDKSKKGKK